MKECEEIKSLLWDYDDNGDSDADVEIRAHLNSCGECAEEYERINRIRSELRASVIEAPEELHDAVMKGISKEKRRKKPYFPIGTVAAAAVILLVFGITRLAPVTGKESASPLSRSGDAEHSPFEEYEVPLDAVPTGDSCYSVDWFGVIASDDIPAMPDSDGTGGNLEKCGVGKENAPELLNGKEQISTIYLVAENSDFAAAFEDSCPAQVGNGYRVFFLGRDEAEKIFDEANTRSDEIKILKNSGVPESDTVAVILIADNIG